MNKSLFHHPDFCPRVMARCVTAELLDLILMDAEILATRGWSLIRGSMRQHSATFYQAQWRLRQAGLVVRQRRGGCTAELTLTPAGDGKLPPEVRPRRLWETRWSGRWSVLVYDVPETDRRYRNVLRDFLRRLRMGCLQGSVWISPRDIRPDYADLMEAGGLKGMAYLFEARTVLRQPAADLVRDAWNWPRLASGHAWYLSATDRILADLAAGRWSMRAQLLGLAREEAGAYRSVMSDDPLLPRDLWPSDYAGERVFNRHREFYARLAEHA